jgi:DNA-binding transcriptional LysR family regulator
MKLFSEVCPIAPSPQLSLGSIGLRYGGMDARKLLYLVSVVEHGSFKKAAKHLFVSQPALSMSMGRLEKSVGGKLLVRGPTGISTTRLGELVYSHARLIRDEIGLAENRIRHLDDHDRILTLGTLPSLATSLIPTALCQWRETQPTRPLKVVEKVQVDLLVGLCRGDLDFVVGMTEFFDFVDGLKQRVLFRDRMYVMARKNHPAHRMTAPSWATLAQFPWIIPTVGALRTGLENAFTSEGIALPEQVTECDSIACIRALVAGSDHLALLAAHSVGLEMSEDRIKPLNICLPHMNRNIAVIFRENAPLGEAGMSLVAHIEATGSRFSGWQLPGCAGN